jgi:phosphoglycolate phosphatase
VRRLLVLWDVDYTLLDAGGTGRELYQIAFREMFGRDMPQPGSMAGRTDRAIAVEVLTLAGVPEPRRQVDAFHALMAARAPGLVRVARERVRALPGAEQAVAALSDGHAGSGQGPGAGGRGHIVQSLLTGNIRPLAEVKLAALALAGHLDLDAGAYGDAHEVRAELVPVARRNAERAYGGDFGGQATVLVGDTPFDVGAALATGARAVGVATGGFSVAELAASGAHAVLPDLADTDRVLAAILGPGDSQRAPIPAPTDSPGELSTS